MSYIERVIDGITIKAMFNELYCGFGRAMNRSTTNAIGRPSLINLLDT